MATAPNNVTPIKDQPTGLALLRAPFPDHQISKLPKPTKVQTEKVRADFKAGIRCPVCQSWHHPDVIHLDYVGHAALTDRLLDADEAWCWEPLATNDSGLPAFDQSGGLWIKLYVCGIWRLGYGHAAGKPNADPGSREKEVIGDALRNAAMRFGAALDLWHKGDLHLDDEGQSQLGEVSPPSEPNRVTGVKLDGKYTSITALEAAIKKFVGQMDKCAEWADWQTLRSENEGLLHQAQHDHPDWWNGWVGQPDRFVPLSRKIELLEATLAQHMTDVARA